MKNKIFSLILILSFGGIVTNCSKKLPITEDPKEPIQSVFSKAPLIKSYTLLNPIDQEYTELISFLSDPNLKLINTCNSQLTKVQFQNHPSIIGIQLSINSDNSYIQTDLLSIYDKNTNQRFSLIREIEGFFSNETGAIRFRSPDNAFIIETHYKDGVNITEYNSLQKSIDKAWNCTYEEFGEFYFAAKEECESDWLCDIACAFNPCTLAYLASATIECSKKTE